MPEQKLDLLQFSSGEMTEAGTTAAEVMGSEVRDSDLPGRTFHHVPYGFGCDVVPPELAVSAHSAKDEAGRYPRNLCPVIYGAFHPLRHLNRSDGILVLRLPHFAGSGAARAIVVSAWLTWFMAWSEVANAWWGTNQLVPVAARQAGAAVGAPWQEFVVKLCHVPAALSLILSFVLLIIGVAGHREPGE
jgi:hypothetical protein